jgi:hypothetical protein
MEHQYRAVYCSHCDQTHIYQTSIVPGCQAFERIKCPGCNRLLKAIRADAGCELVASKPGEIGTSTHRFEDYTYLENAIVDNAIAPIESGENVLES